MGVYIRDRSPYYWLWLERPGRPALRESSKIPITGGTPAQTRANRLLAEAAYAARMGDLARARYELPTNRAEIAFGDFADWYGVNVSVTKGGTDKELSMLKQLIRYFHRFKLHQITKQDGLEWRRRRNEEVSASTVNREMALLKHVLTCAAPKYLSANPLFGLQELETDEVDIRILTLDEEARLLTAAADDAEDYALLVTALDTIQRLTSVASLEWTHDKGDTLVFLNAKVPSKTRRGNWIPISSRLRQALDAIPHRGRFIFEKFQRRARTSQSTMKRDSPLARRLAVRQMFERRCQQAGIAVGRAAGGVTFHCLRHTGATSMLQGGADVKTVMEIGGWRRMEQMQRYLHANRETKRQAVELASRSHQTHTHSDNAKSA